MKYLIKICLQINNSVLKKVTLVSGSINVVYLAKIFIKPISEIFLELKSETLKDIIGIIMDINMILQKCQWLIILTIPIFCICLLIYYIKYKYKDSETINEVIIGHSSMSTTKFKVETRTNYKIEEINVIDEMNDATENYDNIKYAIHKQDKFIEQFKQNINNEEEYGYMGIAHTPLILQMGNKIGDELYFNLFHKDRNSEKFKKLENSDEFEDLKIDTEILNENSDELIVGLSTTYKINYNELNVFKPEQKNLIIFSCDTLDFDVINSRTQITSYVGFMMKKIREISKDKNINKIHMVLSTSVAMTFALGQAISLNNDPNIIIYHYDRNDSRKYTWGLDLSKTYENCLVVTQN